MHPADPATSRNPVKRWLLATAALLVFEALPAAEITGYLAFASDYVWRGVTQSDGDPAAQLGVDVNFDSGWFIGAWGSTIDISNGPSRQRDVESNFYAGYSADVSDRWTLMANVVAYTYPGTEGNVDYDYAEFGVAANFDDRLWIDYAYSDDLYNTGRHTHRYEVYSEHEIAPAWLAGGGIGYYDVSDLAGDGYSYWQIGLTRSLRRFDLDLRYHDTNQWVPIVSSADRADSRVAFTVRFSF